MNIFKKVKILIRIILKKEVNYKPQITCTTKWYGNWGAGFFVIPSELNKDSIVYSFGIGEDISFDKGIIKDFNCKVYGFDPTPKSIKFIEQQSPIENFNFYPYGISDQDGSMEFSLPDNPDHVSGRIIKQNGHDRSGKATIRVPVKKFSTIVKELGHRKIDILKLDIEGSEYDVFDDRLNANVEINQLLIEFHHRFKSIGIDKTKKAISDLNKKGFRLAAVSDEKEEYTFYHP